MARDVHRWFFFCERIRLNKSLQRLELRRSQIDIMAAYCLEDAAIGHPKLHELEVEGNPFGEQGLRAILRALLSLHSHLESIGVTEFRDTNVQPPVLFNYGDLTEDYTEEEGQALRMENPHHRAVLRLILRRTEDFQLPVMSCLQTLMLDGQLTERCPFKKDSNGLWIVPCSGMVEFRLLLDVPLVADTAQKYILSWHEARRLPVPVCKFMYLHRTYSSMQTDAERRIFLGAVSKECCLKLAHIRMLADVVKNRNPNLLSAVVSGLSLAMPVMHRACINSSLLPINGHNRQHPTGGHARGKKDFEEEYEHASCIVLTDDDKDLTGALPSVPVELKCRRETMMFLKKLLDFNPSCANGHYELDLTDPIDYTVIERVLLVQAWDAKQAEQLGLKDLTQGDFCGFRNFLSTEPDGNAEPFSEDWQLPGDGNTGEGSIVLDYVSPLRVGPDEAVLSDAVFHKILGTLSGTASEPARFAAVRTTAHRLVMNANQLGSILQVLTDSAYRQDLYCILFCRCVEFGPPLVDVASGVLSLFSTPQREAITSRVGHINTMDWHHLHQQPFDRYCLNLEHCDERKIGMLLLQLADAEPGNVGNISWTGAKTDKWRPPAEWRVEMADRGVFELTCTLEDPESMLVEERQRLGFEMGWQCGELPAPPEDRLTLSEESLEQEVSA